MSWDIMILNSDGTPDCLHDAPKDWMPKPMGEAASVRSAITSALPNTDWSDPAWGILAEDSFSLEFNFQKDGPVDAFTIHVRGGGDPLPSIVQLCTTNGWVAFDYSTGEMIDLEDPSRDSWMRFQAYRDRIISQ